MQPSATAEHEFGCQCRIGESPIWVTEEKSVYWAGVNQGRVHKLEWASKLHRIFELDIEVTAIALRAKGGWVTASTTGLYTWDTKFENKEFLIDPCADIENVRLNDAVVDRAGRLWTGSLNQSNLASPDGALYRVDADHSVHQIDSGFAVANGIAFSPKGDRAYVSNMLKGEVYAYDLDPGTGQASDRRTYVTLPEVQGYPDGLNTDAEGYVWICHWKGNCITRHHPDTGEKVFEARLPVSNVTRATFCGERLEQLIITSAWHTVEADLPHQPLAGDLFRLVPGVRGLPEDRYQG